MSHPVDRLIGGIFLALFVTMSVLVLLAAVPWTDLSEGRLLHIALGIGIASCILLSRPLLLRTVLHGRDPFLLDDELNNLLLGRVIGIVCGVGAGVYVLGTVA